MSKRKKVFPNIDFIFVHFSRFNLLLRPKIKDLRVENKLPFLKTYLDFFLTRRVFEVWSQVRAVADVRINRKVDHPDLFFRLVFRVKSDPVWPVIPALVEPVPVISGYADNVTY